MCLSPLRISRDIKIICVVMIRRIAYPQLSFMPSTGEGRASTPKPADCRGAIQHLFTLAFSFGRLAALSLNPPKLPPQCKAQLVAIQYVPVITPHGSIPALDAQSIQQLTVSRRAEKGVEPVQTEHFVFASQEDMWHRRAILAGEYW